MRVSSWVRRSLVLSSAALMVAGLGTSQASAGGAKAASLPAAPLATRAAGTAQTWNLETLDGTGGRPGSSTDPVGLFTTSLNYAGQLHEWYFDGDTVNSGTLRHAWFDGTVWNYENLDGTGAGSTANGRVADRLGLRVSALIYNGAPHVMYYDLAAHSLRHAWWSGSAWFFETLDGQGTHYGNGANGIDDMGLGNSQVAARFGIELHVWYRDTTAKTLRHAWWSGSAWYFETLDGPGTGFANGRVSDDVGQFPKVVPWAGQPHVFYYDVAVNALRHAWWSGSAWFFETLDGRGSTYGGRGGANTDDEGSSKMAAKQFNNQLHVYYLDRTRHTLRHAWYDSGVWHFEMLDGALASGPGVTSDRVGEDASAIDFQGQEQVFYYDTSGTGSLRHAWYNNGWFRETLDGSGSPYSGSTGDNVGTASSGAVYGSVPQLHIFYFDATTSSLRHAWYG